MDIKVRNLHFLPLSPSPSPPPAAAANSATSWTDADIADIPRLTDLERTSDKWTRQKFDKTSFRSIFHKKKRNDAKEDDPTDLG